MTVRRVIILNPYASRSVYAILLMPLVILAILLLLGMTKLMLAILGVPPLLIQLFLLASFLGSFVNVVIYRSRRLVPTITASEIRVFGIPFTVPRLTFAVQETLLAINLGGAVMPTILAIYLLAKRPELLDIAIISTMLVAATCYLFARVIRGLGVVVPAFIPPLAACASAMLLARTLAPVDRFIVAYVAGVLGTLIGADLLNLRKMLESGAPLVSIGGAGTFDGIFLSGVFAVYFAILSSI